ncbi:MAG: RNA polymerase sigma factor [Sarcina sp.]
METNLRKNIIKYKEDEDIESLINLFKYFEPILGNVAKKIHTEYENSDMKIAFIDILRKIEINDCYSNESIKGKIIAALIKKRSTEIKKKISKNEKEKKLGTLIYINDLKKEVKDKSFEFFIDKFPYDKEKMLDILTEKQRIVIEKSFFEDKKNVEIALMLKIKQSTVGDLKNRALKNLRKYIERIDPNGERSF